MSWNLKKFAPVFALVVFALVLFLLSKRLGDIEFSDIVQQIRSLPLPAVIGAMICCAAAYLLVGLYEGIALHRVSGQWRMLYAIRTTVIANPVGRAVGVALVSGGALRYRFYSAIGLNARQVGSLIVLMTMPYLLGVGWLIDVSLLVHTQAASQALGLSTSTILILACVGLIKDFGWLGVAKWRKEPINLKQLQIRVPSLQHTFLQIALGIAQILCNTGILFLLMPPEINMSWPEFIPLYCIAFVAGQISNVPAGLGVLEAVLLMMLPQIPPAKLLGTLLAYRAIFEVLPLLIGLVLWAGYEAGRVKRKLSA